MKQLVEDTSQSHGKWFAFEAQYEYTVISSVIPPLSFIPSPRKKKEYNTEILENCGGLTIITPHAHAREGGYVIRAGIHLYYNYVTSHQKIEMAL